MTDIQKNETNNALTVRKKRLIIASSLVVFSGVVMGAYYFFSNNHSQRTDNAYVNGHIIDINSRVDGFVTQVNVDNTDRVKSGDILITLDQDDAKIDLAAKQADLEQIQRQVAALYSKQQQAEATIKTAKVQLTIALSDLRARKGLAQQNIITKEELLHAEQAVKLAQSHLDQANANKAEVMVQITGSTAKNYPTVLAAQERVAKASLNLQRTVIRTPSDGMVAQRIAQLGQQIKVGEKLMSVVPLNQLWIEANFKETQLKDICSGQPVEITIDSYGHKVTYHGEVEDIMAGSGSAFSVLPAQNATGNWIKVIQRVPVRIKLNLDELKQYPLRIGLSAEVNVNTTRCEQTQPNKPAKKASQRLTHSDNSIVNTLYHREV